MFLKDDMRGRMLAQIMFSELEKIANEAAKSTSSGTDSIDENKNLQKLEETDKEVERENFDEVDEKDSIIGTAIIRREKNKYNYRGIPVIRDRSTEGLRFDPSLQKYFPDFNIKRKEALEEGEQNGRIGEKQERLIKLKQQKLLKLKEQKLQVLQQQKQQIQTQQ